MEFAQPNDVRFIELLDQSLNDGLLRLQGQDHGE